MNNIEEHLHEHPELIKDFRTNHKKLLNDIKDSFAGFIESDDTISKYLLSMALLEILRTVKDTSKTVLQAKIAERFGLQHLMDIQGK
jgi:translation initiation factor 2B subunit (eIF-2B alpha/beta/delta family)